MKSKFSSLVILAVMFLVGTSGFVDAAASVGKVGVTASGKVVSTKIFNTFAGEFGDTAARSFMKSLGKEGVEALSKEGLEVALSAARKSVAVGADDVAKAASMGSLGSSIKALKGIGADFATMTDDVLVKAGQSQGKFVDAIASGNINALESFGMKAGEANKLINLSKSSAGALDNVGGVATKRILPGSADDIGVRLGNGAKVADDAGKVATATEVKVVAGGADNLGGVATKAETIAAEQAAAKAEAQALAGKMASTESKGFGSTAKNAVTKKGLNGSQQGIYVEAKTIATTGRNADGILVSSAEKSAASHLAADLELEASRSALGNFGRRAGAFSAKAVEYSLMTMTAAVLFMIPSIFQSAFLAQQQKNALLQTYIPPTKFGNVVLQLPDSVINIENPSMSQFIYYGIPVNNPGENLSKQAKSLYKGVSNPTSQNKISKHIDNSYAKAFTLGAQKSIHIPRYNLDATAQSTLPIFVSYTDQSWSEWAANGIPDAAFTQTMINLNTGYIFYADGTSQGTLPAPLVGPGTNGKTVESFLSKKYGSLKTTGSQRTYTEYVDSYSSSKAGSIASPLAEQFNCGCLANNGGVLSEETLQTCSSSKSSSCLLTSVLNQLSAGLAINSQGTVMTPDQDMAKEIAQGALGQVIPIQGFGNKFDEVLQMFPGAEQNAIANSGVLTVSLGTNLSAATPVEIIGADPDNYSAKGIYIYQCKNTPLAKMLRSQAGGSSSTAYNNLITDYIVFLDQNLNQVPMMMPMQDPNNYNFITMGLNPAIKYVSTIIGSFDANGAFSFLPQLNIQAPAALVAKGLPASFPPLYGLQAKNGSLAINYNQNLTSVIGTVAQSLASNPKLGQQFKDMQAAMLRLLTSGPFGKYKLSPIDEDMQPIIGGVSLILYTGFHGYPVSQDAKNAKCTDLLIPLSAQGKTVVLPSNNVAEYYGLVTDLTYSVNADGTIVVAENGFANSPLSQQKDASHKVVWSVDAAKTSQFYWVDKLTGMGKKSDPDFAMPASLVDFVTQARSAWLQWIEGASAGQSVNNEFAGITIPGTSNVLTIVGQQALNNGLFVYTCSPNPSTEMQDFFVLTNSTNPTVSDPKLGSMSALSATGSTNMLSLVSGQLYNASGALVQNGPAVDAKALIQSLFSMKPQGFSDDLKAKLNTALSQSTASSQAIVYPFMFGSLQLGIYQADLTAGNYLYLNAAGAGSTANFQPTDYLVCIDSYTSPSVVGTKLSSTTQFMVSLVTGQVYGPTGAQDVIAPSLLSRIIANESPSWRSGQAQDIATLAALAVKVQQNQQQQSAQLEAAPLANDGFVTWPQSAVTTVIASLASQNFLQSPYDMIKQDPTSRSYVMVSPANVDGTAFMYTFFDVPNNFIDAAGNAMRVGAMYDEQGNLLRVVQGVELASLLQQYGVAIDAAGKQYLGANNVLPMMKLDPADVALRPGVSGKSMIYSNDPSFPSFGIVSPISYQNSQFYIYFNKITQSYYAMQVSGSNVSYIDMAGGNVYNLNGQPKMALNPVAINGNGDLFLPYLNPDNFVRCVMKNPANNNYCDFLNLEDGFQAFAQDPATGASCGLNQLVSLDQAANNVNIAQMPFPESLTAMPDLSVANQYNVYVDDASAAISYKVNPAYQWQNLQLLPINMQTRAVLSPLPAAVYQFARLVFKNNVPFACVFANQLFSNAQPSGQNAYTLTAGANKIVVSVLVDSKTNVSYISIAAGSTTYNYQYNFLTLSANQLQDYQQNAWKAQTVADITGRIILEESLPVDDSGNLQLSAVSIKSVVNPPVDAASQSALTASLSNVLVDAANGRFLGQISGSTYAYVPQDGFVDLENGVLFDASGMMLAYTLKAEDLLALLQQLTVSVVRNNNSNASALRYRPAAGAVSAVPVVSKSMSSSMAVGLPVQSSSSLSSLAQASSSVQQSQSAVVNPEIIALQQKNIELQADIKQRQASLNREKVTSRKTALQNAISINKQQIAANNKQIAVLSSSTQSRSGLLGRLGSKISKKKDRKNK